jgi:phosphopantetheine adenylyltransferase
MKISEHNVMTDEVIVREANAEELADFEARAIKIANYKASLELKATQRAALLDRLGITEEEVKLLLA